jgi:hypothetical protein
MAYDFNGSTQYLNTASAPVTVAPLTFACWFYPDTDTQAQAVMSITDNTETNSNRFGMFIQGATAGDPLQIFAQSPSATGAITSTAGFTASTWNHACGVFESTTSRTVYLDGANSATNNTSVTPSGVDRIRIAGRFNNGIAGAYFDGLIAEVGIWNAALTAAEVASLAKGMTCDKVRPQSLVFYAPLVRNLQDVRGARAITNNNTATVANHPRVYA